MINLYSEKEIAIMKQGGKILAEILNQLIRETKEGVNELDINKRAMDLIKAKGAIPSFLGYQRFPAAICISINEELVHGVPKDRLIQKGDIVSFDLGLRYQGLCLDKAVTFPIGKIAKEDEKFIKTVKKSLEMGIAEAKVGSRLGKISSVIQKTIEQGGYAVVRSLFGHGVGRKVHEDPQIPNFGEETSGPILKEGVVLAIEPMANMDGAEIKVAKDGFAIVSADGSLTAHFEDTIAITKGGPLILTRVE